MLKKSFVSFLFIIGMQVSAQQSASYTSGFSDFQKALDLYNNQQYKVAQLFFKKIKRTSKDNLIKSNSAYYIANCAIRLHHLNADDLIEDFVRDYPTSTKQNLAYLDAADYYYENSKYAFAKKWYDKVDEHALAKTEKEAFYFNYGYTSFLSKQYKAAKKYLSRVENTSNYGSQAKYYLGFIAYEADDYEGANAYFKQVGDQAQYKEKLSYFQADLNFKLGNFEKAIKLAKSRIEGAKKEELSELSKIIGESYFNLKQYKEAIPYLKAYQGKKQKRSKIAKWNNTDYYQLGYAHYKQKDYDKAISEFNKIVGGKDAVAQNAYYHLGESYVNLDKKQEALNAFRNASQMTFHLKIQEDAWLNYAKISYEIGNPYESIPQVLTSYIEKYPASNHKKDVEALLIDSYITSKNYTAALNLLKNKKDFESKEAYQKVTLYRGLELYSAGNYQEAKSLFEASLSEALTPIFTARARFWNAEVDYNVTKYEDALIGFKQFENETEARYTPEYKNLPYNLAYVYFKLKQYKKAIDYFNQFIASQNYDELRLNDAYLRLGDGYFVSSAYDKAIIAYEKAIALNKIETDYPSFQKALSIGYSSEPSQKIQALEQFISGYKSSKLRDDALFELANTLVKEGKVDDAINIYNQLNREYPSSIFVPKSLLRQGLVYYNANKNEQALTKFKQVAKEYSGSPEALQAVSTARLIYIDLGRVSDYATWVKGLDYIEVTNAELDNLTYQAAEKQYLDNETDKAIRLFNDYINQFSSGIHILQSHFYLAQLYYKKDLFENAVPHYGYVSQATQSEFTEQALLRLSEFHLSKKEWEKVIPILKRLEAEANYPQNIVFAQSNLMKAQYQLKQYNEAVAYADKVLKNTTLDNKIKGDAYIIIARSLFKTGEEVKAKLAYAKVEAIATGETAAEALYYNAYFKNKESDYASSNATIQKLAKDFSGYKFYSAKGLVLMAKNFYALNDAFQATYILESVIQNFSSFEDVVAEAKLTLSKFKEEEAKTNASIIPEESLEPKEEVLNSKE